MCPYVESVNPLSPCETPLFSGPHNARCSIPRARLPLSRQNKRRWDNRVKPYLRFIQQLDRNANGRSHIA